MIYFDMPDKQYRAYHGLGSTDLKNILKSPLHFRHARENPKRSKALDDGSAVHCYLLERERFHEEFAVEPPGLVHKGKNPWKSEWEAFKASNADKTIIDRETWEMILGLEKAIKSHPWASKIMAMSMFEASCIIGDRKGRADLLSPKFIADIKTCDDAESLIYGIQDYQYYLQAAYYLDLFEEADGRKRQFLWIACEKKAPYCVKVFVASDEMIEVGRREYKAALEIYRRCVEMNDWPGYDTDIVELAFKPYFKGVLG